MKLQLETVKRSFGGVRVSFIDDFRTGGSGLLTNLSEAGKSGVFRLNGSALSSLQWMRCHLLEFKFNNRESFWDAIFELWECFREIRNDWKSL